MSRKTRHRPSSVTEDFHQTSPSLSEEEFADIERRFREARQAYRHALSRRRQDAVERDPLLRIGRRRHRHFVRALVSELVGGRPLEDAAAGATAQAFKGLRTPAAIRRKAASLLLRDDVCEVVARMLVAAGLTPKQAAAEHIDLIKAGNIPALKAFYALVLGTHL